MYFGGEESRPSSQSRQSCDMRRGGRLVYGVRDKLRLPRLLFEKFGGWAALLSGSLDLQVAFI
jgi:hypothetical protein